jgi:hypothetical protein
MSYPGMAVLDPPHFPVLPLVRARAQSRLVVSNMSIVYGILFAILFVALNIGAYLWYVVPEPRELSRK